MQITHSITSAALAAAAKATYAEIFAGDPHAARRVLSAEAADVYGEMWGEQTVGVHLVLMACLDSAVSFGDALARRRDIRPSSYGDRAHHWQLPEGGGRGFLRKGL